MRGRSERSRTRVVESALIHVEANRNDPERLALILPGADAPVTPTHWSFGQLASQVGAPAAYLRQLPAPFAANNLQYGLTSNRAEQIKTLETDDAISGRRIELRAVTGPDYGRIYDHELVEAVQKIAGNGTGDTRWKVPGVLDWRLQTPRRHHPRHDEGAPTRAHVFSCQILPFPLANRYGSWRQRLGVQVSKRRNEIAPLRPQTLPIEPNWQSCVTKVYS